MRSVMTLSLHSASISRILEPSPQGLISSSLYGYYQIAQRAQVFKLITWYDWTHKLPGLSLVSIGTNFNIAIYLSLISFRSLFWFDLATLPSVKIQIMGGKITFSVIFKFSIKKLQIFVFNHFLIFCFTNQISIKTNISDMFYFISKIQNEISKNG